MSVTVNAFPPLQSMTSPRGWVLAIIVGLHALFFWVFTSGLGPRIVTAIERDFTVIDVPEAIKPPVEPITQPRVNIEPQVRELRVPTPDVPTIVDPERTERTIQGEPMVPVPLPTQGGSDTRVGTGPVVEAPAIDARMPLSEPDYPASEIRGGHAGTVLLSIYVLENGRIGDVRIDQSSGFPKLDAAAAREAKRWRLKPGTHDGIPTAMWKTIPITFRLNNLAM